MAKGFQLRAGLGYSCLAHGRSEDQKAVVQSVSPSDKLMPTAISEELILASGVTRPRTVMSNKPTTSVEALSQIN